MGWRVGNSIILVQNLSHVTVTTEDQNATSVSNFFHGFLRDFGRKHAGNKIVF